MGLIYTVRLKSKPQRINTVTFYLHDISTPLVGVIFKHVEQIQQPLIYKCILMYLHICILMVAVSALYV